MRVEYRFSSQTGDLPADPRILARPFLLSPAEPHPSLTLRNYFDAVLHFVLRALANTSPESTPHRVILRSEKHGALYHVASAEVFLGEASRKFAVSTAVSNHGKARLNREEALLKALNHRFHLPYLPRPWFKQEIPAGANVTLSMLLAEWFEDYHEWHLDSDQSHRIRIWDQARGGRVASERETGDLYREMSKILTLYCDPSTFRQIRPWHHAAGDFVVKTEDGRTRVRLTTVRGYEALFIRPEPLNPAIALVYFFLDMSTWMRLDRMEGTGAVLWADDFCLKPVVEGFFEALRIMAHSGPGPVDDPLALLGLLKTFSPREMESLFRPLLAIYELEDGGEFSVVEANLGNHAASLWEIIQRSPG
jgi:hypothetical protein